MRPPAVLQPDITPTPTTRASVHRTGDGPPSAVRLSVARSRAAWTRVVARALAGLTLQPVRPSSRRRLPVSAFRALFTLASFAPLVVGSVRADVQIERGFLPLDAGPSSFAIGLPGGVNLCFDPVRGGVSYIWTGGFVDLAPLRPGPGKFIQPAKLLGPVVYRETGVAPLRRGDPARVPAIEFTGYTLRGDTIEFRYTVDGALVHDELRVRSDGAALQRRIRIDGAGDARWWHVVDGRPAVELKRDASGAFLLEVPLATPRP